MVAVHAFAHAIRSPARFGHFNQDVRKGDVVSDAGEQSHHAIMIEAVCGQWVI